MFYKSAGSTLLLITIVGMVLILAFNDEGFASESLTPSASAAKTATRDPTLVLRDLLFGKHPSNAVWLKIFNKGGLPSGGRSEAYRYELATKKTFPLRAPSGAHSILLSIVGRKATYLVKDHLYKETLTDELTFSGAALPVMTEAHLTTLLGFVDGKPHEVLAIRNDRVLVRVSTDTGKVSEEMPAMTEQEVVILSQQSVMADGRIVHIDTPNPNKWNLRYLPRGPDGGMERVLVKTPGEKITPRWSDDGSNVTFVVIVSHEGP